MGAARLNGNPLGGQAIKVASRSDRFRFVAYASAVGRFGRAVDAWGLASLPLRLVGYGARWMPGVLARMPRPSVGSGARSTASARSRMPRQSTACGTGHMPGVLLRMPGVPYRMPRRSAGS